MSTQTLFRREALDAHRQKTTGQMLLVLPPSVRVLAIFVAIIGITLIGFVSWGTYTKKERVNGVLLPATGMARLVLTQSGIITERLVKEGQVVKKGQVLFRINTAQSTDKTRDVQQEIGRELATRQSSLKDELNRQLQLNQMDFSANTQRLQSIQSELEQLTRIEELAKQQVTLARQNVTRQQELAKVGFISKQQLQQQQDSLLSQELKLQDTLRQEVSLKRQGDDIRSNLNQLSLKGKNLNAQLSRSLSDVQQAIIENQARQNMQILAPQDGVVAAVLAEAGQMLTVGNPLAQIIPQNSALQAHLYAPSRAIGFIQPGAPVLLRYQAYPYQKFGQHQGVVSQISRVAVLPNDLPYPMADTSEALYRITVKLKEQNITAYGKAEKLQAGMRLDADIVLDKRRLYEWILEPLYSISGKLFDHKN